MGGFVFEALGFRGELTGTVGHSCAHRETNISLPKVRGPSVQGAGCRVQGPGFEVQGAGFRVQGSGVASERGGRSEGAA